MNCTIRPHHGHHRWDELKRRGWPPERAKTCPGHRSVEALPDAAKDRGTFGFREMDTVVSRAGGRGGLLVMAERASRMCLAACIGAISQKYVRRQVRRWMRDGRLGRVRGVVTDNGREFLDQAALDRLFRAEVYCTHACSSWEKGSVENRNGLIRLFFPKGTDFSRVPKADVEHAQDAVNRTVRKTSLNGRSAHEVFRDLSKAARPVRFLLQFAESTPSATSHHANRACDRHLGRLRIRHIARVPYPVWKLGIFRSRQRGLTERKIFG